MLVPPFVDYVKDYGYENAQENTRGDGNVKCEIVTLDPDVARQLAEERNFIRKMNDDAGKNNY